jgi:hypothetical protein
MLRRLALSALVCSTVVTGGCLSVASFQTADTNGRGNLQMSLEGSRFGLRSGNDNVHLGVPVFNVAGRYGVTDDLDVGARVGMSGMEFMAKKRLFGKPGELSVALAPSVGGFPLGSTSLLMGQLPVLIGIPLGPHQLVLSPKLQFYQVSDSDSSETTASGAVSVSSATLFNVGTGVGFSLKVGDNFRILPEVSIVYPVLGANDSNNGPSSTVDLTKTNGAIYQAGVAFLFGGK